MEVQAQSVIESYQRQLTEAHHKIAILEAQIREITQRQETTDDHSERIPRSSGNTLPR